MNVKLFASKVFFGVKKASPTIAVVGGIGLSIGAIVSACKATPKVDELLDESRKQIHAIHEIADNPESGYTKEQKEQAITMTWGHTILGLCKLYGPAAAMEIVAILLFIWSHSQMKSRVTGLSAAVIALSQSLNQLNQNNVERFGEEKANDIYYALDTQKVEETVTDEETGKEKKVKVSAKVVDTEKVVGPFAVFFDEFNPNYILEDPAHNVDFVSDIQVSLIRRRNMQGYLFLNEARMALGYKPIPAGQVMGWGPNDTIDLGIDHITRQEVRDFRNGYEKVYVIDFVNVHPIIDDITQLDRSNRAF